MPSLQSPTKCVFFLVKQLCCVVTHAPDSLFNQTKVMGILSGVQVDDGESQAAVHLCACVIRIMRESVLCYLSEDGRVELLR